MNTLVAGIAAGVLGALAMDSVNHLSARTGLLSKIGVGLAVVQVLGLDFLIGGPASPAWALVCGVATTAACLFFVYPSMGRGVFGRRSPEDTESPLSSLANHLFFGAGVAAALAMT